MVAFTLTSISETGELIARPLKKDNVTLESPTLFAAQPILYWKTKEQWEKQGHQLDYE
jgi:hypothetical protein